MDSKQEIPAIAKPEDFSQIPFNALIVAHADLFDYARALEAQLTSAREQVEALNGQLLDKQKLYTDAILRGDDLEAQLAAVTGKVTCKHCGREIEHFTVCGVPSNAWRHKETCTGGCPGLPTEAEPRTQSRQGSK